MAETREELYLAKISGEDVAIPTPITRKEKYLYNIAKKPGGGESGGSSGGSSGGKELIITVNTGDFYTDRWNTLEAVTNMSWADAKAAVLDGSLTKVTVLENPGSEYRARVHSANIRSASLDDGMSFSLCIDFLSIQHSGGSVISASTNSIIWSELGDMMGKQLLIK